MDSLPKRTVWKWKWLWVKIDVLGFWHLLPMLCLAGKDFPQFYVALAWLCFTIQIRPFPGKRG